MAGQEILPRKISHVALFLWGQETPPKALFMRTSEPKLICKGRISSHANVNPDVRIRASKAHCHLKANYIMCFNTGNKFTIIAKQATVLD